MDTVKFQQAAATVEKYVRSEQERLLRSVKTEFDDWTKQREAFSKRLEKFRLQINENLKVAN